MSNTANNSTAVILSAFLRGQPIPLPIVCLANRPTMFSASEDVRLLNGLSLQEFECVTIGALRCRYCCATLTHSADSYIHAALGYGSRPRPILESMNSVPILPARLDWPSAIGMFILNFGTLEFLTLTFLESRQTPTQFERTKQKSFQERIAVIEREVLTGSFSAASKDDFLQFLKHLEPIRSLRNHLAHGYILGRWDEATANIVITLSKPREIDVAYSPESLNVEFHTLVEALGQLKELIESFQRFSHAADRTTIT